MANGRLIKLQGGRLRDLLASGTASHIQCDEVCGASSDEDKEGVMSVLVRKGTLNVSRIKKVAQILSRLHFPQNDSLKLFCLGRGCLTASTQPSDIYLLHCI